MLFSLKKMLMFDNVTKENIKETSPNWPQISDHSYRILTNGGSNEMKYQFLINKREGADLKHFNDSKTFIEFSNG